MFRLVAPAGIPIRFRDLVRIARNRMGHASRSDAFRSQIRNLSGAEHCWLVSSGRAALAVTLQAFAQLSGAARNEVVIPAYTCFSVAATAVKCNLKVRPVDIDPHTMDYNYEKLGEVDFSRVSAVLACNLFGIVSDWDQLREVTAGSGVRLVDDAAQTMGAQYKGQPSGALGDVGFYSFDRGKNLTTWSGGALLTSDKEIAARLNEIVAALPPSSSTDEISAGIKLAAYSLLLRPHLYWLPDGLPFLGLGETVFDPEFALSRLSMLQDLTGSVMFGRLEQLNQARAENSRKLAEPLIASGKYEIPGFDTQCTPAYLRLPVLANDQNVRDTAIIALRARGIKAASMYPSTIGKIDGIAPHLATKVEVFGGAEQVVARLLTLPTHPYVTDTDIKRMVDCLTVL